MTEGTKSYLFGCHHFFMHPLMVMLAWKKHFGCWPESWQIVCIFIHDIGIIGMDYLSGSKNGHWRYGAILAGKLFGWRGYKFCAGHTGEYFNGWRKRYEKHLGPLRSDLFWADKKSWLVAPIWWLWLNHKVEFQITDPHKWKEMVRKNLESPEPKSSHQLYMEEWLE